MTKQSHVDDDNAAAASRNDMAAAIEALAKATQSLVATANQFAQFAQGAGGGHGGQADVGAGPFPVPVPIATINVWEDDPFSEAAPTIDPASGVPAVTQVPSVANPRLQTAIGGPRPPPQRYAPRTPEFRYWTAAEALARGINFWGPLMPAGSTWSTANPMRVTLVAGQDLNAFYSRTNGLNFFHKVVRNQDFFSGESPDVVCHELGHAILDALRPQLFNAANIETGAFHEAFGDMSGILSALQLQSLRTKVLTETQGRLNVNSRLSRLAEQLGWAIRQLSPTAVDRDCLRNAANRFVYQRPDLLPPSAPASRLSSEVHSFSRVFTGAFLDALARMFALTGAPNEASLQAVSRDMAQLLVDGVRAAPITSAYYSQVAAAMVQADQARNHGRYRAALTSAFVGRGILAVHAALDLVDAPVPRLAAQPAAAMAGFDPAGGSSDVYAYGDAAEDDGHRRGYGDTPELPLSTVSLGRDISFAVHAASQAPRFEVSSAVVGATAQAPLTADEASRHFVEDLVQLGNINFGTAKGLMAQLGGDESRKQTHVLVADTDGALVLKRDHFDCGFCNRFSRG